MLDSQDYMYDNDVLRTEPPADKRTPQKQREFDAKKADMMIRGMDRRRKFLIRRESERMLMDYFSKKQKKEKGTRAAGPSWASKTIHQILVDLRKIYGGGEITEEILISDLNRLCRFGFLQCKPALHGTPKKYHISNKGALENIKNILEKPQICKFSNSGKRRTRKRKKRRKKPTKRKKKSVRRKSRSSQVNSKKKKSPTNNSTRLEKKPPPRRSESTTNNTKNTILITDSEDEDEVEEEFDEELFHQNVLQSPPGSIVNSPDEDGNLENSLPLLITSTPDDSGRPKRKVATRSPETPKTPKIEEDEEENYYDDDEKEEEEEEEERRISGFKRKRVEVEEREIITIGDSQDEFESISQGESTVVLNTSKFEPPIKKLKLSDDNDDDDDDDDDENSFDSQGYLILDPQVIDPPPEEYSKFEEEEIETSVPPLMVEVISPPQPPSSTHLTNNSTCITHYDDLEVVPDNYNIEKYEDEEKEEKEEEDDDDDDDEVQITSIKYSTRMVKKTSIGEYDDYDDDDDFRIIGVNQI